MARSGVYRRAFVSLDTTEDGKRPNQKGLAFMANIKSQKKRIITNEKRRMRNRAVKSELKTAVRHVKDAVAEGNGKDAYAFACEACRLMDKAASKGVIHKNQAANRKSGIMRLANTVVTAEDIAAYEKPAPKPQKTGSKKAEAKAAMDGRSPDAKEFGTVGGNSMIADRPVEIWRYDGSRAMRIIFIDGEVHEIETASPLYKTEDGLGLSNFLLAKNEDKLKWKRDTRASVLVCLAKGGGLTFYAYGLAPDGASAEETKLRVHRGDVSIDGVNGFSLMTFGSAG